MRPKRLLRRFHGALRDCAPLTPGALSGGFGSGPAQGPAQRIVRLPVSASVRDGATALSAAASVHITRTSPVHATRRALSPSPLLVEQPPPRRTGLLLEEFPAGFRPSVGDPDPYRSMSAIHYAVFKDERLLVSAHSVATCFQASRQRSVHADRWLRRAREYQGALSSPRLLFERTSGTSSPRGLPADHHRL